MTYNLFSGTLNPTQLSTVPYAYQLKSQYVKLCTVYSMHRV